MEEEKGEAGARGGSMIELAENMAEKVGTNLKKQFKLFKDKIVKL
jgi:hypothetical protein